MNCDLLCRKTEISPQIKITRFICFSFILWMFSTSLYAFFILEWRQKMFPLLADGIFVTDAQEPNLLQHERGGMRRKANGERNIAKETLGDRCGGNGRLY
jgi:hypothetical protein